MRFARVVFWIAGIWGVLIVTPLFFLKDYVGIQTPPAVTHAEFYYGFAAVALAWQIGFLIIATDPARYRPIIIACVLEKAGFGMVEFALYAQGKLPGSQLPLAGVDLLLAVLMVASYIKLGGVHAEHPRHN